MHVHINARRWFEKTNGNTYHTVRVLVAEATDADTVDLLIDGDPAGLDVLELGPSERTYGYGTHYYHTAGELLRDAGVMPPDFDPYDLHLHTWRKDHGITLTEDVADVPRRKDLHQ